MQTLKYAWQRLTRGYDDRVQWGFDGYFLQVMPALKEFCLKQLADENLMKWNPWREKTYRETIRLIEDYENMPYKNEYKDDNEISKLLGYVGSNIGYFWD